MKPSLCCECSVAAHRHVYGYGLLPKAGVSSANSSYYLAQRVLTCESFLDRISGVLRHILLDRQSGCKRGSRLLRGGSQVWLVRYYVRSDQRGCAVPPDLCTLAYLTVGLPLWLIQACSCPPCTRMSALNPCKCDIPSDSRCVALFPAPALLPARSCLCSCL